MNNEKLMRFLWDGGWSTDIGRVSVFTDKYSPLRSKWYTHRRTLRWLLTLAKQAICRHPQWVFSGAGSFSFELEKAALFLPDCYQHMEQVPVIRHNFRCKRCGKGSYRIVPDFNKLDSLAGRGEKGKQP
jgi:hypothetical protein